MMMMKRRMDRWNCDAGSHHDDINDNTGIGLLLRGVRGFKQLTEAHFRKGMQGVIAIEMEEIATM